MSILPITAGHPRNTHDRPDVQRTMSPLNMAVPLLRALILAILATALIMVGLPAVLAIASAAAL
jgi:hypothetical protein